MDVVDFVREYHRMCGNYNLCSGCPINKKCNPCMDAIYEDPQGAVEIVEKWAKEHPAPTNADKLREVFGGRGETIAHCMGFQFGLWDKWLAAPYEAPKEE